MGLGLVVLPPGLAATALRVFPAESNLTAMLTSFVSYGIVAYGMALLFLLIALVRARRRTLLVVLTALTAAMLGCHLIWLAPLFVADHRPATTAPFTVLSLNLLGGNADSEQLMSQAAAVDVAVLLETTPTALRRLEALGWDRRFPYAAGGSERFSSGSAIYSRYPLTDQEVIPTSFPQRAATAAIPGIGQVRIVAVHPCNPFCGEGTWLAEHEQLRSVAAAHRGQPLVLAGDFNAVEDHLPLRRLRADGLVSATDLLGAGWLPTYPANRAVPPVIPIDHVLLSPELTATALSRFAVSGTDHLGLITSVAGTTVN
ncbi:MAG TPA: endonuclease/exonuclease/phosphatase family protein [Propionibacteriaceae bacterium]|nr:endonuclease/exonuclease/phosphatase family protein [Propionibacteriaceae bacterium]